MILSDNEIEEAIKEGKLKIDPPLQTDRTDPSSIDLHLGNSIVTFPEPTRGAFTTIEFLDDIDVERLISELGHTRHLSDDEHLTLVPGDFVLAFTRERIELSNDLAARVEGRSSLARFGVSVHQTAPTVHATFKGQLRLELTHSGPYRCNLRPGIAICQLILERLGTPATGTLQSQFQNQRE